MTDNIVWVVGRNHMDSWFIEGIYHDKDVASSKCKGLDWFIGPVKLNEDIPIGNNQWSGLERPFDTGIDHD